MSEPLWSGWGWGGARSVERGLGSRGLRQAKNPPAGWPISLLLASCPVCSASVEADLRQQLGMAQRIIRTAQLSRRHQPPPAAGAAVTADGQGARAPEADLARAPSTGGSPAAQLCSALEELGLPPGSSGPRLVDAVVQRTSSTALDSAALGQERLRLAAENEALRAVIAAVEAGSGVEAPGAVDGPLSTLLVVNERLQKALGGGGAVARRSLGGSPVARQQT